MVQTFTIAVSDEVLSDLRSRLAATRFTRPTSDGWAAGVDPAYLRSLVDWPSGAADARVAQHVPGAAAAGRSPRRRRRGAFLPGYLFSQLPDGPATRAAVAESFHRPMTQTLGYERYFAFGSDIDGSACGWLSTMYPEEVAGLLAFIIDKLRDWADCHGDLESRFSRDG